jgi:tetratricopeptide (TPR) repeat protein
MKVKICKLSLLFFCSILFSKNVFCQDFNKADSLFNEANNRLKTSKGALDSITIVECISKYTNAIKYNQNFWQAYRNRSRLYFRIRNFEEGINDLTHALNLADSNNLANLYDERASFYFELKSFDKAIEDWTRAIEGLGDNKLSTPSLALFQRAKSHWFLGNNEKSCSDYMKALQLEAKLEEQNHIIFCN